MDATSAHSELDWQQQAAASRCGSRQSRVPRSPCQRHEATRSRLLLGESPYALQQLGLDLVRHRPCHCQAGAGRQDESQ